MKRIGLIVTLLAMLCVAFSLNLDFQGQNAREARLLNQFRKIDFTPKPLQLNSNREMMLSGYISSFYTGNMQWENELAADIEYNTQGQIHRIFQHYWDFGSSSWIKDFYSEYSYRPDGKPEHVTYFAYLDEEWYEEGGVEFNYDGSRIQTIRMYYTDGEETYDLINYYFVYETDSAMFTYLYLNFNLFGRQRFNAKVEYVPDGNGRPVEINFYALNDAEEWIHEEKALLQYHPQDQNNAETVANFFLFQITYGEFEIVLDGTVLLIDELTSYLYDDDMEWYAYELTQYAYNPTMSIHQIQTYADYLQFNGAADRTWTLVHQEDFDYDDDLNMALWTISAVYQATLIPQTRVAYSYTDLVSTEDHLAPAPISNLKIFPNPFNPKTNLSFELEKTQDVQIEVYNLKGQKVRTLLGDVLTKGTHQISWDGKDDNGLGLGSGMYILRLKTGSNSRSAKVILLK